MAQRILLPQRTEGDGMEGIVLDKGKEHTIVLTAKHPQHLDLTSDISSSKPHQLPSSVIHLVPHTIEQKKKDQVLINLKNKEPKFVPYEPYKACVKPIIPNKKKKTKLPKSHGEGTVVEGGSSTLERSNSSPVSEEWEVEKLAMESEMCILRTEHEQLQSQLKYQVQVNGELKNLLVAAVGEDMQVKVHGLTEDKLHLARALLKSANSLSTHQEQTEWLAGQCEVWRSKFLASSVMVEELARWKAGLTQKVNETQDVLRKLLEEKKQVRCNLLEAHKNLLSLRDNFDLVNKRVHLKTSNALDVSAQNAKLSGMLVLQLLASDKSQQGYKSIEDLPSLTPLDAAVENALSSPHLLHLVGEPDAACNAVVGAAIALSGQLYLEGHPPKIQCCAQCSGKMKLV